MHDGIKRLTFSGKYGMIGTNSIPKSEMLWIRASEHVENELNGKDGIDHETMSEL